MAREGKDREGREKKGGEGGYRKGRVRREGKKDFRAFPRFQICHHTNWYGLMAPDTQSGAPASHLIKVPPQLDQ